MVPTRRRNSECIFLFWTGDNNQVPRSCRTALRQVNTRRCDGASALVNVGIFASGLLWGGLHYKYNSTIPDAVKNKVCKWTDLATKYRLSLPQVAYQTLLLVGCGMWSGPVAANACTIAVIDRRTVGCHSNQTGIRWGGTWESPVIGNAF